MSKYSDLIARRRALPPEEIERQRDLAGHGKRSTYAHWFCRCDLCRAENARYSAANQAVRDYLARRKNR